MKQSSLFIQLVDKYFAPVVRRFTELVNGKKEAEQLLYKTMLDEEFSPDLKWESSELNGSIVAADIVALDSSLPLKKRDTLKSAVGKIPKLGMKLRKDETDIINLNIMLSTNASEQAVARKLLNDVPRVISGVEHRLEVMFQQGLSTGLTLITADDTNGTGVRADFGYKEENIFHCTAGVWGSGSEEPIDDIQQLADKAAQDGHNLALIMMSTAYFNILRKSAKGKLLVANNNGQTVTNLNTLGKPTPSQMLEALEAEFSVPVRVVSSSFVIENVDGSRETIRPWEQANVVGLTSTKVGRLVYGRVAEEISPVTGVSYEKSGSYILVSKFSENEPLEEFTTSQAFALPVIDGGNSVYVLHADSNGDELTTDVAGVEFGKAAGSKEVDIHYDGDETLTATSNANWATVKLVRDKLKITVTANEGSARNGVVTITAGTLSTTVTVNQE